MPSTTNPASTAGQTPRVKIWLEVDGDYTFGHGIEEILLAVERTGSIKQAAAELGKSYRYVWGRIKKAEQALHRQLVVTQVGGQGERRSSLTDFARGTLQNFMELRKRVREAVEREFASCFGKSHDHAS